MPVQDAHPAVTWHRGQPGARYRTECRSRNPFAGELFRGKIGKKREASAERELPDPAALWPAGPYLSVRSGWLCGGVRIRKLPCTVRHVWQ